MRVCLFCGVGRGQFSGLCHGQTSPIDWRRGTQCVCRYRRGGDPAFLARFENAGNHTKWLKLTRYSDYLASFDDVALGLAPLCPQTPFSRGKSFGKVLAYLGRRVPVIASDACEHGAFFDGGSGVVSNDVEVWVDEAARLLHDPCAR